MKLLAVGLVFTSSVSALTEQQELKVFQPGDAIKSSDMNGNFNYFNDKLSNIESKALSIIKLDYIEPEPNESEVREGNSTCYVLDDKSPTGMTAIDFDFQYQYAYPENQGAFTLYRTPESATIVSTTNYGFELINTPTGSLKGFLVNNLESAKTQEATDNYRVYFQVSSEYPSCHLKFIHYHGWDGHLLKSVKYLIQRTKILNLTSYPYE